MAVVDFGGTVTECLSTYVRPARPDGWFLKEVDSGLSFIRKAGTWVNINLGLAFIKATKSGKITTNASGEYNVVFATPFSDNLYCIVLCVDDTESKVPIASKYNRAPTGFSIRTRNATNGHLVGDINVSWLATRDYNP